MRASDLTELIDAQVRALVADRPVVVVCTVLAGATRAVAVLRDHGASDILVVGFARGTGPLPDDADATCVECDFGQMSSVADEIVLTSRFVNDPPAQARAAVAAFDPAGVALVVVNGFPGRSGDYLDRETVGGRPLAFESLEDKTLSEQIWRAADVLHAPETVVACEWTSMAHNAARLDAGAGTVWSADASDGMNGGADRVFRVRGEDDARAAYERLREVSRQVRIMPFLEGVPCSIHGIVLPDGVAVLRPVELIVLRQPGATRFVYAGISTGWDPPPPARDEMRDVARRVGRHLADAHDYRGGFGVDGVLTIDGFRPTELNPRFTGGLNTIAKGIPDLPMQWLHNLLLAGGDLGVRAGDIERILLDAADSQRFGAAYTATDRAVATRTTTVHVTGDEHALEVTEDEQASIGTIEHGPGPHGDLVRFTPHTVPAGTRLAPWGVATFELSDRLWNTGFGPLSVAPDVTADGL